MQGISVKDDNGQPVGYMVIPADGDDIEQDKLEQLLSYIETIYDNNEVANLISIEKGKFIFDTTDDEMVKSFVDFCEEKITERIIIPQNMGNGPTIRHRVFYFGHTKNSNEVIVKYTTLGDFNNIDVALETLIPKTVVKST